MKSKFTTPQLNKSSKYWYVHYRYEGVQFRDTYGLNKIKDLKLREAEYNKLCSDMLVDLKNGYNPNIPDGIQSQSDMLIVEALRFALDKKKPYIDPKTFKTYRATIDVFETSIISLSLGNLKILDLKRLHIRLILEKTSKTEKWTDKTHNKCLGHLKILLSELVKWDITEANSATGIDNIKVDKESDFHKPASDPDIDKIRNHLIEKDFRFYVFSITVFHTGIRMKELLLTTLSMVNMAKNEFNLIGAITKNGKARTVPINKHLKEYLFKMDFSKLPKDYYLFGSFKEPGMGNRGKNQHLIDFTPAPTPISRDTAGRRWKKLVKDDLGITMNLYAMKHHGADKKILAGMNMDSLRELYGHSSKLMTEKYAKIIKEVYRKDIMDNSPDF
jgi:integrase